MLKNALLTWLFTCFIGTLLLCFTVSLTEGRIRTSELELIAIIGLGITLLASIPAMIIYGLLAAALIPKMNLAKVRAICSGYAVLATALSFVIMFASRGGGFLEGGDVTLLLFALPYALCFVLAICIFPLPAPKHAAGPDHIIPEEQGISVNTALPASYYIVAAIAGLQLLYAISSWLTRGLIGRNLAVSTAWHLIDIGLLLTGLILFIRHKAAGWKLMVLLSSGGLIGSIGSLATNLSLLTGHSSSFYRFYITIGIFSLLDATALMLLSGSVLRSRYRTAMSDYGLWILAGGCYAILRIVLARMLY